MSRSKAVRYFNDNARKSVGPYDEAGRKRAHAGLIRLLPKRRKLRMLDVGAGWGANAALFASMGHDVLAVEPAKNLRDIGKNTFKNKNIKWKSDTLPRLKSLHLFQGRFDAVYCINVVQYLNEKNRRIAFNKIVSFAKEGGLVYIQYPSPAFAPHQFTAGAGDIRTFVRQFNASSGSPAKLKILRQAALKERPRKGYAGRKALDGSDIYYHTAVIRRLKKPAPKPGDI